MILRGAAVGASGPGPADGVFQGEDFDHGSDGSGQRHAGGVCQFGTGPRALEPGGAGDDEGTIGNHIGDVQRHMIAKTNDYMVLHIIVDAVAKKHGGASGRNPDAERTQGVSYQGTLTAWYGTRPGLVCRS